MGAALPPGPRVARDRPRRPAAGRQAKRPGNDPCFRLSLGIHLRLLHARASAGNLGDAMASVRWHQARPQVALVAVPTWATENAAWGELTPPERGEGCRPRH